MREKKSYFTGTTPQKMNPVSSKKIPLKNAHFDWLLHAPREGTSFKPQRAALLLVADVQPGLRRRRNETRQLNLVGRTDAHTGDVASTPISPKDILATAFHQLGIDPDTTIPNTTNQPMPITGKR